MITENTMFWILLFFAMGICPSDAWICGNTGQCRCTSSGEVICTQITAAPYFTADYRLGRRLTIKTSHGFDTVSLADTIGFERVMVIGLSIEQCASAMDDFPAVMCISETTSYRPPVVQSTHPSRRGPGAVAMVNEILRDAGPKHAPAMAPLAVLNGVIIWTVISGVIGAILTACILVSLVNLHARINTHARCNDPPMYAVNCCLKCIAVALCPFHLMTKSCKCTGCCLYALDASTRGATTSF